MNFNTRALNAYKRTRFGIGMKNILRLEKKNSSVWHTASERENTDLLCAKSQSAINAKNVHRFVCRSSHLILDDLFLQLMCSMRARSRRVKFTQVLPRAQTVCKVNIDRQPICRYVFI